MSTSPLLQFDYIQAAQNQKEVTANAMGDRITQALCNYSSIAMTDADFTLTTTQAYANMMVNFTGALTAGRNIIVPSTDKLYIVRNSTTGGYSLTVKAATGTGIAVPGGQVVTLYFDGTNVIQIAASATAQQPYDMPIFLAGLPSDGATIFRCKFARAVIFPISLSGSQAVVGTNPTATATYTFNKNGTSFGTLAISSVGGLTWTSASGASFATGDILTVVAPSPADSTLADVGITLVGTR